MYFNKKFKVINNIIIDTPEWRNLNFKYKNLIRKITITTLDICKVAEQFVNKNIYLSIILSNDQKLHELNKIYRNKDRPTNALSFPYHDFSEQVNINEIHLGDIFISYQRIIDEATDCKKHLLFLIVHSVLHLVGYDHQSDADTEEMEALEQYILNIYGQV
jgi:probable rRNA maturation factor